MNKTVQISPRDYYIAHIIQGILAGTDLFPSDTAMVRYAVDLTETILKEIEKHDNGNSKTE